MMTVAQLIDFLKTQPQDILVAYDCYSEQCLLRPEEIELKYCCPPRPDGWVEYKRPDKSVQQYLIFPGN